MQIVEQLRMSIANSSILSELASRQVTASFGVTIIRTRESLDDCMQRVDSALYQAKNSGRNQAFFI